MPRAVRASNRHATKKSPRRAPCVLRKRKSKFIEIFRTTPVRTVCPNFYVMAHANSCTFSPRCSYCYLKSSFWFLRGAEAFTNTDRMMRELRHWIAKDDLESYMMNIGNLSDSLAFEDVRPLVGKLVELFREEAEAKHRPHCLLLVTKGGLEHAGVLFEREACLNVIVSFSVNSSAAARKHERGAAPVSSRMRAAGRLKKRGWRVRIRIDPMIRGYEYACIIKQVKELAPERVTLGTLRAEKNLPRYVGDGMFADLKVAPGEDMARYPMDQRIAMYRPAVKALRDVCPIGFCEETPEVWSASGVDPSAKSCNCGS